MTVEVEMRFQGIIAAMILVTVMVEAHRTLPRPILSFRGQVVIDGWFAPPSHFKVFNGSTFIPPDDINMYQSERPRPFIPTDDFIEEFIRCLNDTNGPVNVWWSPFHTF
jgi:hypothetical protein